MRFDRCNQQGCPGHLAKFGDCLTEALYDMSNEGFADETTGSTEFEGHYALFLLATDHTQTLDESQAHERKVTIPAGAYIVFTSEAGTVALIKYGTEHEAREDFARADAAYETWIGDD